MPDVRGADVEGARVSPANGGGHHRDVLAAERKERARIRGEKGIRWRGRPLDAAV
jgi:hypothetical protein